MIRWGQNSPEVRALLDRERIIPPQPPGVRARAIANARAALTARDAAVAAAPTVMTPRFRWAAGMVAACVASAALGAGAYALHARRMSSATDRPATGSELSRSPVERDQVAEAQRAPTPPAPSVPGRASADFGPATARAQAARRQSQPDIWPAELRLLRQARAAVVRENFEAALVPLAEHARRFKDGRLAEEREALRVKALAGLGRTEEARHAAASFRAHFPHSVLLPAVRQMPAPGP
jgi:hypothetical protein